MGGNALKIPTVRLETNDYINITTDIKPRLEKIFGTEIHLVNSYHNKLSHGDADFLVFNNEKLGNIKEKLILEFNPNEIVQSGKGIHSFDYQNFQIDIISCFNQFNFASAKDFYDYDPSGMIMGSVCHGFNLKYGANGLHYVYRSKYTNMIKEVALSKDSEQIFNFLDYDYQRFKIGFNNLDEIFDFCISSKYFTTYKFSEDELNRHNRKRKSI